MQVRLVAAEGHVHAHTAVRGQIRLGVARYTYLCADLVAALAGLDVHDFSHFGGCVMRSSRSDE